jgi:hypothetical protein
VDGIVDIFIDFLGHFTLILFCNENWHVWLIWLQKCG